MKKIKTVFVVGPTASGKTMLGVELAKKFNGEIISADSMQIYKDIHIASAAPEEEEKCGIKHHLLEFIPTDYQFSVADFVKIAKDTIYDINSRGKLPIIVGGTGLYIDSLANNIIFSNYKPDQKLRKNIEDKFNTIGAEKMLEELSKFDPSSAKILHPNDKKRIIRAFEIYQQTGTSITEQNKYSKEIPSEFDELFIGINYKDRQKLYERIDKRVDIMIECGLLKEAEQAISKKSTGSFQAIGHKEFEDYFNGNCNLQEAIMHLKQQTRHYAKRQLTWFRKNDKIKWIYRDQQPDFIQEAVKYVDDFYKEE